MYPVLALTLGQANLGHRRCVTLEFREEMSIARGDDHQVTR